MPHRRSLLALVVLLLVALAPLGARAAYNNSYPAQPGFTHSPLASDDPGTGKQLAGGVIRRSSPTIADIDSNAGNGKEIVVGGNDGKLYAYHKDGSLAWSPVTVPPSACSYPDGDGLINSSPAVGDLFGNGVQYIVVGYGTITRTNCPGGVAAYDGRNGALLWRYPLQNSRELLHGVLSSPALADVDGDGKLEVGFGNFERDMVMLRSDGSKLWRYSNADTVWSSPAFADVDGDGLPDMIIGSDISANPSLGTQNGGYVTALRGLDSTRLWRKFYNQVIWSSPVIADLDRNGSREVIVGSGCYTGFNPAVNGHWIKILDLRTGNEIRTLNTNGCVGSTPALGDIDGDGQLEIVAVVNGSFNNPQTPGVVQAWDYDNPTPKWTIDPRNSNANANDQILGDIQSAVLADLDGNGSLEVILANLNDVVVLRGTDGAQLTCRNCTDATKSMFTFYTLISTPAVGDLDGTGGPEVVIGGGNRQGPNGPGYLYVWTNFSGLGSPSGPLRHYSAPWPMFHGGPTHVGVFVSPQLRASTDSTGVLVAVGDPAQSFNVALTDDAGGAISWSASANVGWISLSPGSGSTPGTLRVTVNPNGKGVGTYNGTISISSADGSPTIDVKLVVVNQVRQTYLPLMEN